MPLPTEGEIQRMHHYFAVECNNNAWELADLAERTDEQNEEMVSLAEVAAWHWSKVGTPINFARADMLLGWVCFIVGWTGDARGYTQRVRTQLQDKPEWLSPWDEAFFLLLEARARLADEDQAGFDAVSTQIDTAREKLDHEGERDAFDRYRAEYETMINIALYQPIIPQNVGNIARTCVGMNAHLHIIGPTIVDLSDKAVKRAGLDYWDDLMLTQHDSPDAFFKWADESVGTIYAVTKFAMTRFDKPAYRDNDILLFGGEREGLPPEVHKKFEESRKIAIPIPGAVRSYNLGNAVAITLAVAMSNAELWPSDWAPKDGYIAENTFSKP